VPEHFTYQALFQHFIYMDSFNPYNDSLRTAL